MLRYGEHAGRLVMPARATFRPYDDLSIPDRQTKCRSCVIYSDDHGATWQTSAVCLPGTGEAVLYERTDGTLVLNAGPTSTMASAGSPSATTAGDLAGGGVVDLRRHGRDQPGHQCGRGPRFPPELCDNEDLLLFTNPAAAAARSPANPAVSGNRAPCA